MNDNPTDGDTPTFRNTGLPEQDTVLFASPDASELPRPIDEPIPNVLENGG